MTHTNYITLITQQFIDIINNPFHALFVVITTTMVEFIQ